MLDQIRILNREREILYTIQNNSLFQLKKCFKMVKIFDKLRKFNNYSNNIYIWCYDNASI